MKTPREVLLQRHREAEPALDDVRAEVLRTLTGQRRRDTRASAPGGERFLGTLWQELFVACRRYWMGLGAAWCVIVILAAAGAVDGSGNAVAASLSSEPMIQAMRERQRLRDELLGGVVTEEVRTVRRDPVVGPRSEAVVEFVSV